jgi:hypothetical protein
MEILLADPNQMGRTSGTHDSDTCRSEARMNAQILAQRDSLEPLP